MENDYSLPCLTFREARDAAYRLVLDSPKDVTLEATTTGGRFGTTYLSITRDCEDQEENVVCDDVRVGSPLRVRELPAGTYFVLLETTDDAASTWSLTATVTDPLPRGVGDVCSTAVDITPAAGMTTGSGSAELATAELDTGTGCGGAFSTSRDVVFSFTTTELRDVQITTETDSFFHYSSLRRDCPTIASEFSCTSGSMNTLNARSVEPGTYFVTVSRSSSSGTVNATVELSDPTPIPPNDRCSGAIDISGGYSSLDTLLGFGDDVAACTGLSQPDAFYAFTLTEPKDALIAVRTFDGSFTNFGLTLRGSCDSTLNVACDSGSPGIISQTLEPGDYILIVESSASSADDFVIQASFFDPA